MMKKLLNSFFPSRKSKARPSKKKPSWLLKAEDCELSQTRLSAHIDIETSTDMALDSIDEENVNYEQQEAEKQKRSFDCRRDYRCSTGKADAMNMSSHTHDTTGNSQSMMSNRSITSSRDSCMSLERDAGYTFPAIDQRHVEELAMDMSAKSALPLPKFHLPSFDRAEVLLCRVLGRGAFSDVRELRVFYQRVPPQLRAHVAEADNECSTQGEVAFEETESRAFVMERATRRSCGRGRYAVKSIRRKKNYTEDEVIAAILDLHTEARLLQALVHPNIIGIHATGRQVYTPDYFLVLDRLHDTLQKRIKLWSEKKIQIKRDARGMNRLFRAEIAELRQGDAFLKERLVAANDLAGAIGFMHECRIIHRDIKPENIGFDIHDNIKIFDLGSAREMRLDERLGDGTYNFSILTGSLRYMPPEVMLGRSYNDRADVYSFSIVLWEMIALERPYTCSNNSERQHKQRVCVENIRPPLKKFWSHGLQSTLRLGWDGLVQARSSMVEIKGLLEKEVR